MRAGAGRVATHRGGLAGFEQPRFLQVDELPAGEQRPPAASELIQGQALLGRALLGITLIGAGTTLVREHDAVARFGWLVALVWLPGIGLLDLAQRRWHIRHLGAASLVWDVALIAGADAMLHVPATAAVGYLLITAFHAYVGGPRRAFAALALCAGSAVVVPLVTDTARTGHLLAVELLGLGLMAWLLADASQRHDTSRAGLVQVSEKAAAILAGIADSVVVMTPRGRVQEWNPAAARMFGCPPGSERGATCAEVLGLQIGLRALHCDDGCALLAEASQGDSIEVWRRGPSGRRQPLLSSASAVVDERGTPIEVIHSFRDITALKAADEAKTLFLATASHELKTPLTVIHGFAQMLHRAELPAAQRAHALIAIEARSRQLTGIVDRLLMSSRIDAGRIELDLVPLDLTEVLHERAAAFQAATSRRVEVTWAGAARVVHGDHDAIATVLDHLLDNAVKYSPDGGAVRIVLQPSPREGQLMLSVVDEGIGMSTDQIEQCFERFWQAETTDVRRFGGTGIGLYIVRSLVEAMRGDIDVRSAPGEGTSFDLHLRTSAPMPSESEAEAGVEETDAGEGQSSMIREYMRQVGVPLQGSGGRS